MVCSGTNSTKQPAILPIFFLPFGITLILLLVGLLFRRRRLVWTGVAVVWFSSTPFVSALLMRATEGRAVRPLANDPEVARMVTLLRYNGENCETGEYHYHGYTALLDNVQAAVLDVKRRRLLEWTRYRRHIAQQFRSGLEGVGDLQLPYYDDPRSGTSIRTT